MDKELLKYYEDELQYIKNMGETFAKAHPQIAGRLKLGEDVDSHAERLIEAFSFLTARVNRKLDSQFDDIIESFFNILFPQYNRPIPSFCIVQITKDQIPDSGYKVPRKTELFFSKQEQYKFNTCYPVNMHPITIDSVTSQYNSDMDSHEIKIKIKPMKGKKFSAMKLDSIRFFITDNCSNPFKLYDLIHNFRSVKIKYTNIDEKPVCKTVSLSPVGFEADESLSPFHDNELSFPGFRLLHEYFNFPEKFLFFDVNELNQLDEVKDFFEICIYPNYTDRYVSINDNTFCLHATPAVNVFERIAHINIDHKQTEYPINTDYYRNQELEVFSVENIWETIPSDNSSQKTIYKPFCSFYHSNENSDDDIVFWNEHRRISLKKGDNASDMFLSFNKTKGTWDRPEQLVFLKLYCINKNLKTVNESEMHPTKGLGVKINCIKQPTIPVRPFDNADLKWRLLSHLALNFSSLTTPHILKETLHLYNMTDSIIYKQLIDGVNDIQVEHITRKHPTLNCFYRGLEVSLWMNEDYYIDNSLILFSNVIDFFFGQFISINSFIQLTVKSFPYGKVIKQWEPQNGYKIVL